MINVNTFKPGITFEENGEIFSIISTQHSKQGRGQASVKVKVKNLRTGATIIKSYTGGDKVKTAHILKKDMDFLYSDGTNVILMDEITFEQVEIPIKKVEWEMNFLNEGQKIKIRMYKNEILDIELPMNITLKVTQAPDAVKGNTQNNPQKKVVLETNYELEVPMFIKEKEYIIVSTSDGKYIGKGHNNEIFKS